MKDLKSKDSYEELKAKRNPSGNCPSRRRYSSWKWRKRQLWQQRRRQIGCCTMWPDSLPTSLTPDETFTCSKVNKCNFKQFQFIWFTWKKIRWVVEVVLYIAEAAAVLSPFRKRVFSASQNKRSFHVFNFTGCGGRPLVVVTQRRL